MSHSESTCLYRAGTLVLEAFFVSFVVSRSPILKGVPSQCRLALLLDHLSMSATLQPMGLVVLHLDSDRIFLLPESSFPRPSHPSAHLG